MKETLREQLLAAKVIREDDTYVLFKEKKPLDNEKKLWVLVDNGHEIILTSFTIKGLFKKQYILDNNQYQIRFSQLLQIKIKKNQVILLQLGELPRTFKAIESYKTPEFKRMVIRLARNFKVEFE